MITGSLIGDKSVSVVFDNSKLNGAGYDKVCLSTVSAERWLISGSELQKINLMAGVTADCSRKSKSRGRMQYQRINMEINIGAWLFILKVFRSGSVIDIDKGKEIMAVYNA